MSGGEIAVPDGKSGAWRVETFTVSERAASWHNLSTVMGGGSRVQFVSPGTYKRLVRGGTTVMSNTPMEVNTNAEFVRRATGRVLINGLGLGMVLTAILRKPDVTAVWVVERSPDVIALVAPTFADDARVVIIEHDALTYKPPPKERFACVWHDIWDDVCADNVPEMSLLKRRYGHKTQWQGCWMEERARRIFKREQRPLRSWGGV